MVSRIWSVVPVHANDLGTGVPGVDDSPIGSAVALLVFKLVSAAHFRVRSQTNARWGLLVAAIAMTAVAFLGWRKVRDHRRELASVGRR